MNQIPTHKEILVEFPVHDKSHVFFDAMVLLGIPNVNQTQKLQILSGLITYLLLAIYCQEQHGEPVSIRRVRQHRNQIRNEATQQALDKTAMQNRKQKSTLND